MANPYLYSKCAVTSLLLSTKNSPQLSTLVRSISLSCLQRLLKHCLQYDNSLIWQVWSEISRWYRLWRSLRQASVSRSSSRLGKLLLTLLPTGIWCSLREKKPNFNRAIHMHRWTMKCSVFGFYVNLWVDMVHACQNYIYYLVINSQNVSWSKWLTFEFK